MNKLSKAKRDQIILVGMGTLILLAGVVFGLIRPQYDATSEINSRIIAARDRLQSIEDTIKKADAVASQLADVSNSLAQAESDLASGDPAQWIYNTIRNFKEHYQVDIAVNSQLSVGELELLPRFPYKQLKVSVGGTAFYHDLGKFVADFENAFPHAQITGLSLDPAGGTGDNSDKLTFRMEIIALANPTGPQG
jgi:hypothetical protein